MTSPKPIITVRGLVNAFGTHVVHNGLDIDIFPNEIVGIVGGSGSGKSVLLRTIIGLEPPDKGSVTIYGKDITQLRESERQEIQKHWGVLFQNGALISSLTVEENVMLPLEEHTTLDLDTRRQLAALKIAMAGLPVEARDKFPAELSGGMKKRAALARAMALDPRLLFLDEPTAGLDPIGAHAFDELISNLQQQLHLTIIMITHDLDTLFGICHRIAVLIDKKIIIDTLENIMKLDHPWIRDYFHGPRARAAMEGKSHG